MSETRENQPVEGQIIHPRQAFVDAGKPHQFQPGNPGRPRGIRNRLSEDFLHDLYDSWREHGRKVIDVVAKRHPAQYMRIVSALVPRHFRVEVNDLGELSDEQLRLQLAAAIAQLEDAGAGIVEGAAPAEYAQQIAVVPAVPEANGFLPGRSYEP